MECVECNCVPDPATQSSPGQCPTPPPPLPNGQIGARAAGRRSQGRQRRWRWSKSTRRGLPNPWKAFELVSYQFSTHGVVGQLGIVLQIHLFEDAGAVSADRFDAQEKFPAD